LLGCRLNTILSQFTVIDMREILEDIQDKLQEGFYYIEEHVRVCIVLRILQQLGWDIWNPTEVNTEFKTVPNEDATRVDVALFANQYSPSVFIEIKAVGKMDGDLGRIEQQLRDYNRNNTAEFSIITDGQKWRFYYSLASGEFGKKCFKHIDIVKDDLDDVALLFQAFLAKSEILNGNAKKDATHYLDLNQRQQAMEDAFPKARRLSQEPPYPRLPEALITIVQQSGIHVSLQEPNRSCPRHYNANQELTICLNTQFQVNTQPFLHGNNPELEGEVVTCPKTVRNAGSSIVVKHITVESRITNS